MRVKKLIAAVAAITMVCSLAACGSETEKAPDAGAKTASESESKELTAAPVKEEKPAAPAKTEEPAEQTAQKAQEESEGTKKPAEEPAKTDLKNGSLKVFTDVTDGIELKDSVYTIAKGGEYTFTGNLPEGRIVVDAGDEEVTIVLDGVNISSAKDSVIFVENAEEVTIKAHEGTVNTLNDNRAKKVSDDDTTGGGCIYAKDDLKLQGKGTLIVNASYNNGIHCKNDIKIKNLTLVVTAPGNGIKGNDSITVESGDITVTSTESDGFKTKSTEISPKGKQRGIIEILSGKINVTAADDCFKAAYDLRITEGPDTSIVTGKY